MADYRISRASSDPTPSVDADYPPARDRRFDPAAEVAEVLAALSEPTIERRKSDNVRQAIEYLALAGRRAGDR